VSAYRDDTLDTQGILKAWRREVILLGAPTVSRMLKTLAIRCREEQRPNDSAKYLEAISIISSSRFDSNEIEAIPVWTL